MKRRGTKINSRDAENLRRARQFTEEMGAAMGIMHPGSHEPQTAYVVLPAVMRVVSEYPDIAEDFVEVNCLNARMHSDPGLLRSALPTAVALAKITGNSNALQTVYESARQLGIEEELRKFAQDMDQD